MKRFISDCHFYDAHVLSKNSYDQRKFASVHDMNEHMIEQWNSVVDPADDVYIIGDLAKHCTADEANELCKRLNGRLHLVIGNNDKYINYNGFDQTNFVWTKDIAYTYVSAKEGVGQKREVMMCHYPLLSYVGQYQLYPDGTPKVYMLYGHVHGSVDENLVNDHINRTRSTANFDTDSIPCNMINCFCMFSDYKPLTLAEWIKLDTARRSMLNEVQRMKAEGNVPTYLAALRPEQMAYAPYFERGGDPVTRADMDRLDRAIAPRIEQNKQELRDSWGTAKDVMIQ